MATYLELFLLGRESNNNDLLNRVAVAATKKAQLLLDGASPTVGQVTWAAKAIANPLDEAQGLLNYVLAANSAATVSQITNATDAAIQTNVNKAADALIAAGVA